MCVMRRGRVMAPKPLGSTFHYSPPSSAALNGMLCKLFVEAYLRLCFTVKDMMPCQVNCCTVRPLMGGEAKWWRFCVA